MKTTRETSSGSSGKRGWQTGKLTIVAHSGIVLLIVILFSFLTAQKSYGQGVGISEGSITPNGSAILELRSTLRGFLAPRMTTAQRTAIAPVTGLTVYDTDTRSYWYWDISWIPISGGASILDVANGGTGRSSLTTNYLFYGNGTSAINLLPPGGTTGALLMNTAAGAPSWSLLSGLPTTAGILPVANGGTGSSTLNFWRITGNSGTNPTTNFVGTTDNTDLVFRTNGTEKARIVSATGDLKIGDAVSGTVRSTLALNMREDGDFYGSSILTLINMATMNGAIFETVPNYGANLVDFIFKTSDGGSGTVQRNFRFETRASMAKTGSPSFHIGGLSPDAPTLSVGDDYSAFNSGVRIGTYPVGTVPIPVPTALLHLNAGTSSGGTAPLKFTAGTNLSTPEAGAVEYNGTNLQLTNNTGTRYTIAKMITSSQSLNFGNTTNGSYSDVTVGLTGAVDGDIIILGPLNAAIYAGSYYTAWVSSSDNVTVRFFNNSGASVDPPSRSFRICIIKY